MQQPIDSDSDAAMFMRRWMHLQIHVRCGLSAHDAGCVRRYVHLGLRVARCGNVPPASAHLRTLQTLLRTAQDETLPWTLRRACLEQVELPLAQLTLVLANCDPIAVHAIEARVQQVRDQWPALPRAQVID